MELLVLVKYKKEDRNVVVKKMKGESMETKRCFQKEAGLLSSVKGHRNVTRSDSLGNMTCIIAIPSFRIWGNFSSFRLLGFGAIFRHSIIQPFCLLGSPKYAQ